MKEKSRQKRLRLLAEARARNEVKVSIESELSSFVELERALEQAFGIQQVLIAC